MPQTVTNDPTPALDFTMDVPINGETSDAEFYLVQQKQHLNNAKTLEDLHNADAQALADHLSDGTDAHDASAISYSPSGSILSDNVAGAITELDSEKATIGSVTAVDARLNSGGDIDSRIDALEGLTRFNINGNQFEFALAINPGTKTTFQVIPIIVPDGKSLILETARWRYLTFSGAGTPALNVAAHFFGSGVFIDERDVTISDGQGTVLNDTLYANSSGSAVTVDIYVSLKNTAGSGTVLTGALGWNTVLKIN